VDGVLTERQKRLLALKRGLDEGLDYIAACEAAELDLDTIRRDLDDIDLRELVLASAMVMSAWLEYLGLERR
jgi:hypothetical protein